MAIKEKPLSGQDQDEFKNREKELKDKVKVGIDDFTDKEVLTDKTLLKGLNLRGDDSDETARPKAKKTSTRTAEVADDEEEGQDDEEETDAEEEEETESEAEDDADETESEEEADETEEEEESEEESEEETDEDEGEEEGDEELDPKGKKRAEKRIKDLVAKNKALETEIEQMRSNLEKPDEEPSDPKWKRLDKIYEEHGEAGLEQLQDEIAVALRKTKSDEHALELQRLNRLATKFLREAPDRFRNKQLREFQKVVVESRKTLGKDLFSKGAQEIFGLADSIFRRSKSLQRSKEGQAEAWRLAEEHWVETRKKSRPEDKQEKLRLQRSVNRLKKRTTLAGKQSAGREEKPTTDLKKMRQDAARGGTEAKLAYLKETMDFEGLIPDDLRG